MGHSQWSRFTLGSRNPCIDRKLKPALVYAIRVPRFAQSSLPKPSEVNPSGFSAPYIICSSSLFYRPRPPTDLPPTQPNTRRLRASFLSDSFRVVVFGSPLLLEFAGVLELFRFRSSFLTVTPSLPHHSPTPSCAIRSYCRRFSRLSPRRVPRPVLSTAYATAVIEAARSNRPYKRLYRSLS